MKFAKNLMAAVLFATSLTTFAQDATLKQNMKEISKLVKAIAASVTAGTVSANDVAASERIVVLFQATQKQSPDFISEVPADQQATLLQQYQHMIQQEIDLVNQLHEALAKNDVAAANAILTKMNDLKKEGHDRFDP